MKLIRYGERHKEKTGVVIDNDYYDTSAFGEDYDASFFATDGISRLQKFVEANKGKLERIPENSRLGSPFARPSKIVCTGLNYADHAEEMKKEMPTEPIIFMKATTSLAGPNDTIIIPRNSEKTDYEIELAFVMGKKASYVEEEEAMDYVAGFCVINDVSERSYMFERGGTWDKGKGCDTFAPMGPYLVTTDEIADTNNMRLWLKVNGETRQDGTTANFIFKIPHLISYMSQFMTLLPGDVVSTGSPAGVGFGQKPPVFLKPGDVLEMGIDGLGTAKQQVKGFGEA